MSPGPAARNRARIAESMQPVDAVGLHARREPSATGPGHALFRHPAAAGWRGIWRGESVEKLARDRVLTAMAGGGAWPWAKGQGGDVSTVLDLCARANCRRTKPRYLIGRSASPDDIVGAVARGIDMMGLCAARPASGPHRAGVHPAKACEHQKPPAMPMIARAGTRTALAPPAPAIHAPTCNHCSARRK